MKKIINFMFAIFVFAAKFCIAPFYLMFVPFKTGYDWGHHYWNAFKFECRCVFRALTDKEEFLTYCECGLFDCR